MQQFYPQQNHTLPPPKQTAQPSTPDAWLTQPAAENKIQAAAELLQVLQTAAKVREAQMQRCEVAVLPENSLLLYNSETSDQIHHPAVQEALAQMQRQLPPANRRTPFAFSWRSEQTGERVYCNIPPFSRADREIWPLLLPMQEQKKKNKQQEKELTPAEIERSVALLKQTAYKMRRHRRSQAIKGVLIVIFISLAISSSVFPQLHFFGSNWWIFWVVGGGGAVDIQKSRQEIERLSRAGEPRTAGVLAMILQQTQQAAIKTLIETNLLQLLPQMKNTDARWLDREQHAALTALLENKKAELRLAALKALGQVGNESAVWMIEQLSIYDPDPNVRTAAPEAMSLIMERLRRAEENSTLLRPSAQRLTQSGEALLRPAEGVHVQTSSGEMLRAADKPEAAYAPQANVQQGRSGEEQKQQLGG